MPNRKEATFIYMVPTYPDRPQDDPVTIETVTIEEKTLFQRLLCRPAKSSSRVVHTTRAEAYPNFKPKSE